MVKTTNQLIYGWLIVIQPVKVGTFPQRFGTWDGWWMMKDG